MVIKGFRAERPNLGRVPKGGIALNPSFVGALFLAPTKEEAILWAHELGVFGEKRTVRIYYYEVRVNTREQIKKRRWGEKREITILPPFEIVREEKVKECSYEEFKREFSKRCSMYRRKTGK